MQNFVIEGGAKLSGKVQISGSKNAALPIICATLLSDAESVIKNVPDIEDVHTFAEIFNSLGRRAEFKNNTFTTYAGKLKKSEPEDFLVRKMRGSVLLLGPMLARLGKIKISYPGGDVIGPRPINVHLDGFSKMGVRFKIGNGWFTALGKPKKAKIVLSEISVTATENLLLGSVLSAGETVISLAATEPHVTDLAQMLVKMGAQIKGIGTHRLAVTGVKKLKGVNYSVIPDQVEAGTFAILGAAAKSNITVNGFVPDHHELLLNKFNEVGVDYVIAKSEATKQSISLRPTKKLKATKVRTDIYPGFPSDLQAPFAVLLTQANGQSEIFETMFDGRLNYVYELQKMGARINLEDNHTVKIFGPTPLYGAEIRTFDIRAGATLILAALISKGKSVIHDIEHIDRGYEKIDQKLRSLGAKIERISR